MTGQNILGQEIANLASIEQLVTAGERPAHQMPEEYQSIRVVASAGRYDRRAPLLVDDEEAIKEVKEQLAAYFAVRCQQYSARLALCLRRAQVAGQGAVVTRSGTLVAETVAEFTSHGWVPDGFVRVSDNVLGLPPATRQVKRPCLLAKRPWYRNYGHWLVDCAAVIAMMSAAGLPDGTAIIIGCYDDPVMERVVRQTIERVAPRTEILVHSDDEIWECDALWYFAPLHVPPLFKLPGALHTLRAKLIPTAGLQSPARRLFISRGGRTRLLLNENELLGLCVKHGFELVYPDRLSLTDQAALFHEAQIVVGVKGAALTNAIFLPPGAAQIVLSPGDFPDPFFWDICGQIDVSYLEIFGTAVGGRRTGTNDFRISADRLQTALSLVGVDA
jgi:capsular polysaccharide biosynthesis protein